MSDDQSEQPVSIGSEDGQSAPEAPKQEGEEKSVEEVKAANESGLMPEAPVEAALVPEEPSTETVVVANQSTPRNVFQRLLGFIGRHRLVVIVAGLALCLIGGGGGVWLVAYHRSGINVTEHFAAKPVAFRVVSTTPDADQTGAVNVNKIVVNFNKPVDPDKLNGDFFVSPLVDGSYSQGDNANQAVFTPAQSFPNGTSVKVMIHGEFQSRDGEKLGADYTFGFTTATPDSRVIFNHGGYYEELGSVPAGVPQTYSLVAGDQVKAGNTVTVYKSAMTQLLASLTYSDQVADKTVDTTGLAVVKTQADLKDGDDFKYTPDKGVYLIVATNQGKQAGYAWLVASDFGVIVRQDDQQVVLATQDYTTGTAVKADATLYQLKNAVKEIGHTAVDGAVAASVPYTDRLDAVVVSANGEVAIAPVNVPDTLADVRMVKDLSTSQATFGFTDRPTYSVGEKIHYAGFIRLDNDGAYGVPAGSKVALYVSDSADGTHFADANVTVPSTGVITADFLVGGGSIPSDEQSRQLYVYNGSAKNDIDARTPIGAFTVTKTKLSTYALNVTFSKASYLAGDTINAVISGTDASGAPLAGKTVTADVYAKNYYENETAGNLSSFGTPGDKITDTPLTVTLDASGHGTVHVDVSKFTAGNSHVATVQASIKDPNGETAAGGASAVVHEGDGVIVFGSGRSLITSGGKMVARVYARTLSGGPLANAPVYYTLTVPQGDSSQQVGAGTATTDSEGFVELTPNAPSGMNFTNVTLNAWTVDTQGNKISATNYYYKADPSGSTAYSDVQLHDLDISGASQDVSVGQTLKLTINAPQATHALVTLERGRIHSYKLLDLSAGDNSYSLPVTDELAPSFSLVLSYFRDNNYHVEGVTYTVSPSSKRAVLQLTVPATLTANQLASVVATVKDTNGKPMQTPLVLGAVSASSFNLSGQATPDIFDYLYGEREITTNASSSLLGIGSGGGRCGGGGPDQPALLNPLGTTVVWQPDLSTDASGSVTAKLQLPKGTWRIYAYSADSGTVVGSNYVVVTAQ